MGMKSEFFPNILSQNFFANFLKKIVKNVLTFKKSFCIIIFALWC